MKTKMPLALLLELRRILERRQPDLVRLMDERLDQDGGDKIRGVLTEELADYGVGPDGEINDRGRYLDDLIDRVGRLSGLGPGDPKDKPSPQSATPPALLAHD
jgi:hypothetical protein